ncbi:hypothetical protein FGO68_gene16887 [Halteria grandinella]|uniref:START domain-containing protein n=1 Tax=Halteria grandinella TaxID=5974 RepID=A0A8J8NZC4_HALGN|nr:hypothetical protein FGO68_gene16887 [Halteria grandinella]
MDSDLTLFNDLLILWHALRDSQLAGFLFGLLLLSFTQAFKLYNQFSKYHKRAIHRPPHTPVPYTMYEPKEHTTVDDNMAADNRVPSDLQKDLNRQLIQIELRDRPPKIPESSLKQIMRENAQDPQHLSPQKDTPQGLKSLSVGIRPEKVTKLSDDRRQIKEQLLRMLRDAYATRAEQELVKENPEKNQCIIRKRVLNDDESQTQILLEMEVLGIQPRQFASLFENIQDTQLEWNEHCTRCELIQREEEYDESVDIFVTRIKSPGFFLAGRVFVDARYMLVDKDQYIAIFSSLGNDKIIQSYTSTNDLDGATLARSVISGHWWMPLTDLNKKVIGTRIFYLNQSDFGGSVPKWIARQFVPKAVEDTYDALIKAAKNIHIPMQSDDQIELRMREKAPNNLYIKKNQ